MPRPKRTRVASTRTTAPAPAPEPQPQPEPASDPSTDIYDVSDREKEKQRQRRESAYKVTRTSSLSSNPRQAKVIEAARKKRDSAMDRLESMTSTLTGDKNTGEGGGESYSSSIEVEMGRRAEAATPAHGGRVNEVSGLDLDDDLFNYDGLNTSFDTAGSASVQRSLDTSTLSVSHFKRRPRAGSFLGRDDGPPRPSSRAGPNTPGISSTFNIGVFKRRAREPSILGTAQKPRPERAILQSDSGDRTDDEGEYDQLEGDSFAPEVECTPLRRSSRRSEAVAAEESTEHALSSVNTRKRKSTEAHEQRPRSSPFIENTPVIENTPPAADESEHEIGSSPPVLPRMRDRSVTPAVDEDITPPQSSGSESEAPVWPPLQSLAKKRTRRAPSPVLRRTPVRDIDENPSDISSPPSLTYSPNYAEPSPPPQRAAKQTRRAAAKAESKVTTADLTGLLPRRRQRSARNDPFAIDDEESDPEVDASGLGNDDDELSYLDVRSRRKPARPLSRAGTANQTATANGKAAQRKTKAPGSSKPARTYGRSSDKENDGENEEPGSNAGRSDDVSENSEELVARVGVELKNAARKFAEVDKWELEYEEMTQSSSPKDAR